MKEENLQLPQENKKELADMLQESLEINREILQSVISIKRYFHWRIIWNIVKVVVLVLVVVFGIISFQTVTSYLQGYTLGFQPYAEQLNQLGSLGDLMGN